MMRPILTLLFLFAATTSSIVALSNSSHQLTAGRVPVPPSLSNRVLSSKDASARLNVDYPALCDSQSRTYSSFLGARAAGIDLGVKIMQAHGNLSRLSQALTDRFGSNAAVVSITKEVAADVHTVARALGMAHMGIQVTLGTTVTATKVAAESIKALELTTAFAFASLPDLDEALMQTVFDATFATCLNIYENHLNLTLVIDQFGMQALADLCNHIITFRRITAPMDLSDCADLGGDETHGCIDMRVLDSLRSSAMLHFKQILRTLEGGMTDIARIRGAGAGEADAVALTVQAKGITAGLERLETALKGADDLTVGEVMDRCGVTTEEASVILQFGY